MSNMEEGPTDDAVLKPVAFQVTVKEATGVSPFKELENKKPLLVTESEIRMRLEMAEERRLSLKTQVQEQAANELKKVQEKTQKAQEEKENWQKKIGEELAADLEAKELNRLQLIEQKKLKLRQRLTAHSKKVEEMNSVFESARKQLSEKITAELVLAEDRRNKQLEQLQDRFKEHGAKIVEAKKNVEEAQSAYADQLEEKHMEKLENGLKNRQEQLNVLLERLKEHSIRIENVRKNRKRSSNE